MGNIKYVEMTIEEALVKCNKNTKILVAVSDLSKNDCNESFCTKKKGEYEDIFQDVQTVISSYNDFVNQLKLFTVKQKNYPIITPEGLQKTILLRKIE